MFYAGTEFFSQRYSAIGAASIHDNQFVKVSLTTLHAFAQAGFLIADNHTECNALVTHVLLALLCTSSKLAMCYHRKPATSYPSSRAFLSWFRLLAQWLVP